MKRLTTYILSVFLCLSTACKYEGPDERFQNLLKKADEFEKQGKWEEARVTLLSAVDAKPKNDEGYYRLADALVHLKKFPQAVENYRSALNFNPANREARLRLAAMMLAAKEFERAESDINKLLDGNPKDIDARILKANLLSSSPYKNYAEAKKILEEVLKESPDNTPAIASLADVNLRDGNSKEAEELFSKALSKDSESAPIKMALADLFARQGRLDEAQQMLESLVTSNPESSSLRMLLAEFFAGRGMVGQALEQYEESLKTEPLRHDARDRLYDMYLTRKGLSEENVTKAKNLSLELAKIAPSDSAVKYFKARDLEVDGKLQEALAGYLSVIEVMNNFPPPFRRAGLIELATGKPSEGLEHLTQAVALMPADVISRLALARTYFAKNDLGQAAEQAKRILDVYPRHLAANIIRADVALLQGDLQTARQVYEFLVKAFPSSPVGYYKLALLEEKAENIPASIENYKKCLKFDKNVLLPARRMARLIYRQKNAETAATALNELIAQSKDYKAELSVVLAELLGRKEASAAEIAEARKLLQSAIEMKPNLVDAYIAVARIDAGQGDPEASAKSYKSLVEQQPNNSAYRMMLALTLEQTGKSEEAAEEYRQILSRLPKFAPAANNLAWLMADKLQGNLDEALRLALIGKEGLPQVSGVTDTLGWIYFLQGQPRSALPYLEDAAQTERQNNPNQEVNPEILYHLAEARFAVQDYDGARETINEILRNGSTHIPKYDKIQQLLKKLNSIK